MIPTWHITDIQERVSASDPGQSSGSTCRSALLHFRYRDWTPGPQGELQSDQSDHGDHSLGTKKQKN